MTGYRGGTWLNCGETENGHGWSWQQQAWRNSPPLWGFRHIATPLAGLRLRERAGGGISHVK
jgi:hypothetical protein